jgi:hypothetical protein
MQLCCILFCSGDTVLGMISNSTNHEECYLLRCDTMDKGNLLGHPYCCFCNVFCLSSAFLSLAFLYISPDLLYKPTHT